MSESVLIFNSQKFLCSAETNSFSLISDSTFTLTTTSTARSAENSIPIPTLIQIDPFLPANGQKGVHNRWHSDIPAFATVKPGEIFKIQCHAKAIWDFEGIYAQSRHIPGVRFAGIPHPGLIGTAPSHELLNTWNTRERGLIERLTSTTAGEGAVPPVAYPPEPKGAYVGVRQGQELSGDVRERVYRDGARTIPGREHGGNCDIKNLSRGSRCYFPVFVEGANSSVGNLHFSQGDGEMAFCGPIEMAGIITLITSIIKDGVDKFALKQPIFVPSPIDPQYSQKLVFEGISVDLHGDGQQYNMDATIAYKQAALNAIAYLQKLGYKQAYLLLSAAPIESHIGAVVDSPNACVTLGIPTGIFEQDILPKPDGLERRDWGQCAIRSDGVL